MGEGIELPPGFIETLEAALRTYWVTLHVITGSCARPGQ